MYFDHKRTTTLHVSINKNTYHANMAIDVKDALVGALFVQFRQHQLLYTKNNPIFATDSNCCTTTITKDIQMEKIILLMKKLLKINY